MSNDDQEFEIDPIYEEWRDHGWKPIPFDIDVYGETAIRVYKNHVEISMNDWNKFKHQIIKLFKGENNAS